MLGILYYPKNKKSNLPRKKYAEIFGNLENWHYFCSVKFTQ